MKVSDMYRKLSFGKLSNLGMSSNGSGIIIESKKPQIIEFANDALFRLYSKFNLSQKDVLIEMVSHITNYHLIKKFAESSYDPREVQYPYIKDLPNEPFEEDVIKILSIWNSLGCRLPLNDPDTPFSAFTPAPNILQVPRPLDYVSISVMYQAKHKLLIVGDPDQEIVLPEVLDNAFLTYIAYSVYSSIGSDGSTAKAQEHLALFDSLCTEAVEFDLLSTSVSTTNSQFDAKGWK